MGARIPQPQALRRGCYARDFLPSEEWLPRLLAEAQPDIMADDLGWEVVVLVLVS